MNRPRRRSAIALDRLQFRFFGWLAGWAMVNAGRAAKRQGDLHELQHCVAAVTVGNSAECTTSGTCTLGRPFVTSAEHTRGLLPDNERDIALGRTRPVGQEDRSAGRWCALCGMYGSHHTDRHELFVRPALEQQQTSA